MERAEERCEKEITERDPQGGEDNVDQLGGGGKGGVGYSQGLQIPI